MTGKKDDRTVRRQESPGELSLFVPDAAAAAALGERGFDGIAAIASSARAGFIAAASDVLGADAAARAHAAACAGQRVLDAMAAGIRGHRASAARKPAGAALAAAPPVTDGQSATGPGAYLAALLDFAVKSLKNDGKPIDLAWLEAAFLQPFGKLPASGAAEADQLTQVRVCIECVRAHLGKQDAPADYLLAFYESVLAAIGTSYAELRAARTADADTRKALADRLGIDLDPSGARPDRLDRLFLQPDQLSEAALEKLFGTTNTAAPFPPPAVAPDVAAWQADHLRALWREADWSESPPASARPIIDPDLTGKEYIAHPSPGNPAFDLWSKRQQAIAAEMARLKQMREQAPDPRAGFDAIVLDAVGSPMSDLMKLYDDQKQGRDIAVSLQALHLDEAAFAYLVRSYQAVTQKVDLLKDEWQDVYAILTQAWKQRQYDAWRGEEKAAQVCLDPALFQVPQPDPTLFPPPPPPALPAWRAATDDLLLWQSTLRARAAQAGDARQGLAAAAGAADAANLPALRDALLLLIPEGGTGLDAKAAWFYANYQVDTTLSGDQLTTRVGQAIEAAQGILWAVRTGQMAATRPKLTLGSRMDFDDAWRWVGSYAAWQAATLVTLYPENYLAPGLRQWTTPGFDDLVAKTRAYRQLTPTQARLAADGYADAYREATALVTEASCYAETRVGPPGDPAGDVHTLYYMFARGAQSQRVYWSAFDPDDKSLHPQTPWAPVPGFNQAINIVGAAPYKVSDRDSHILLIGVRGGTGGRRLALSTYDLNWRAWSDAPADIDPPEHAGDFAAVIEQHITPSLSPALPRPPRLMVRLAGNRYYRGTVNAGGLDAGGWAAWAAPAEMAGATALDGFTWDSADEKAFWAIIEDGNKNLVIASPGKAGSPVNAYYSGLLTFPGSKAYLIFRPKYQPTKARYMLVDNPGTGSDLDIPAPVRIAVCLGTEGAGSTIIAVWYGDAGAYRCPITDADPLLKPGRLNRAAPCDKGPYTLTDELNDVELVQRRAQLDQAFKDNAGESDSILDYLREAYYYAPIQIATQLEAAAQYVSALDWLRTVYDYTKPAQADRSVGLAAVARPDDDPARAVAWLSDPLDAHRLADGRPDALQKYVLLSLIGCFLSYADAEFARDTAESVPRARALYSDATALLAPFDAPGEGLGADAPPPATIGEALSAGSALRARANRALLARPAVAGMVRLAAASPLGASAAAGAGAAGNAAVPDAPAAPYAPAVSPAFAVPPNPILQSLRLHAQLNLYKIRSGRNIAGMARQLDPYALPPEAASGMPIIGGGGELALPAPGAQMPTDYRYSTLIERAKQLAQLAAQVEAAFLSALEKRDAEYYNLMKARQDLGLARAGVQLGDLRIQEASDGVTLANMNQDRSSLQVDYYQGQLSRGLIPAERDSLAWMRGSMILQLAAAGSNLLAAALPASVGGGFPSGVQVSYSPQGSAMAIAGYFGSLAGAASTQASIMSTVASYERRQEEWQFQESLAQQDARTAGQQITIAQDQLRVVGQERAIAALQAQNAQATVEYLANKFTNAELYDWMSKVLEGVYRFFLQQATGMAQVAAQQLAFERQAAPLAVIQADYWETNPAAGEGSGGADDRRGLTGSARLLQDIYRLDQYAFETARRKLQLTKTISLARLAPSEFQAMKTSGVMTFATPMELFDRDFPGHYLRLISRVRVSVIALVPAIDSIKATLAAGGASRVVVSDGDIFRRTVVRRPPQSVALTSARDATGMFDLAPVTSDMLLPFECTGVDTTWQFSLPRAANRFDYGSIADVLLTLEYTALDNYIYRVQVIRGLDPRISSDRPFGFRQEFADAWYDLHNPDQAQEPMVVHFTTRPEDFPPNLSGLAVQHVVLYFSRAAGRTFEVPVKALQFTPAGGKPVGGGAVSIDGVISTRRGNAPAWLPMVGRPVAGDWRLEFPDQPDVRKMFQEDWIEDMLLVITYAGRLPHWPED